MEKVQVELDLYGYNDDWVRSNDLQKRESFIHSAEFTTVEKQILISYAVVMNHSLNFMQLSDYFCAAI